MIKIASTLPLTIVDTNESWGPETVVSCEYYQPGNDGFNVETVSVHSIVNGRFGPFINKCSWVIDELIALQDFDTIQTLRTLWKHLH